MTWYEALIFGLVQGLTEFLPISSDGHLEMVKFFFGGVENSFPYSIAVHGATTLSILVVFRKEIFRLLSGAVKLKMNEETSYLLKIFISMIPVLIVGLTIKNWVESLYTADMTLTGSMLIVTALFLVAGHYVRKGTKEITYGGAFLMGIAQALAVLPGLSRSGSTISTGLILGHNKDELTKFSFLMVIIPIIGANFLELILTKAGDVDVMAFPLIVAFVTAFIAGYIACRWMIKIVSRGKLIWFAIYCVVIGITLILVA